jgi:hypothetical protein
LGRNEPQFRSGWGIIGAGGPPQFEAGYSPEKPAFFYCLEAVQPSIGSLERTGAGAARETAGTVPAQTLDRSATPGGAIWADRPAGRALSVLPCAYRCFRKVRPAAGYDSAISRRGAPEVISLLRPLESRGRRESRVPMTPAVVRTRCTRRTAGAPEHPAFPAQWFYGLCRALPGAEFLWPPSPTDWRLIEGPVGPDNLHQLDTSNGCQDHAVLPSAASSRHTPRPARMLPEEVSTEAFKRRSSVAPSDRSRE